MAKLTLIDISRKIAMIRACCEADLEAAYHDFHHDPMDAHYEALQDAMLAYQFAQQDEHSDDLAEAFDTQPIASLSAHLLELSQGKSEHSDED